MAFAARVACRRYAGIRTGFGGRATAQALAAQASPATRAMRARLCTALARQVAAPGCCSFASMAAQYHTHCVHVPPCSSRHVDGSRGLGTGGLPRCHAGTPRSLHIGNVLGCCDTPSGAVSAEAAYEAAAKLIDDMPRTEDKLRRALPHLSRAAELGHTVARSRLGRWYLHGLGGLDVDYARAYELLRAAAIDGDNDARYWAAQMLLEGPPTTDDTAAVAGSDTSAGVGDGLLTFDDTGARQQGGYEAAQKVILEIRALRKAARRRKVRGCVGARCEALNTRRHAHRHVSPCRLRGRPSARHGVQPHKEQTHTRRPRQQHLCSCQRRCVRTRAPRGSYSVTRRRMSTVTRRCCWATST